MGKKLTQEDYDQRIAVHGRVIRLEPFKGTKTKILHRCLIHNEEHYSQPQHLLRGHSLSCCSRISTQLRSAKQNYDKELVEHGKAERVGDYVNSTTKIPHRCLIHNEIHMGKPSRLRLGGGLICCRNSWNEEINKVAREKYDEKLKKHGRVIRLGEYIDNKTKILHECLIHNEVHMSSPSVVLKGGGLKCCSSVNSPLYYHHRVVRTQNTFVYLYNLVDYEEYIKLGITNNINQRKLNSGGVYGDLILSWTLNSRLEAECVEKASLRDNRVSNSCPESLKLNKWPGYTEVTNSPEDLVISVIKFYIEKVEKLGPYQFILDYLSPTEEEREICLRQLDLNLTAR